MDGIQESQKLESAQNVKVLIGTKKRNKGWDNVIQKPLNERFWAKVGLPDEKGCWNWTGAKGSFGYGKIRDNYKHIGTHRVSYELNIGKIPCGLHVLHKCDNPLCVNPKHLFLGTQSDNMKDMFAKKRDRNQYSYDKDFINGRSTPVEAFINNKWVCFPSLSDASRKIGVSISKISLAYRKLQHTAGGLKWRRAKI